MGGHLTSTARSNGPAVEDPVLEATWVVGHPAARGRPVLSPGWKASGTDAHRTCPSVAGSGTEVRPASQHRRGRRAR
jgi:hypothetical protein